MNSGAHKIRRLIQSASKALFYRRKFAGLRAANAVDLERLSENVPATRLEELVAERITSGDPYASRWCGRQNPSVLFQLDYDTESSLYLPLDGGALRNYAEALRRCWALLGLERGNAVAIYDYGTSPLSFLASAAFTPYLKKGAAEALGCLAICNDGLASMSKRAVEILKYVRPRILFVRTDCLQPLTLELENQLVRLADYVQAVVVSENEGLLPKADQTAYEQRLGVALYRLLRVDLAMFFAVECPECRLFHSWQDLYWLESPPEDLTAVSADLGHPNLMITNRFARACPTVRYISQVQGSIRLPGCPRGPQDIRIAA